MRTVLYRSMMVFALLVSFSVHGDDTQPDCRSWWSELDGVHHCLLSGNGEVGDIKTPIQNRQAEPLEETSANKTPVPNQSPSEIKIIKPEGETSDAPF